MWITGTSPVMTAQMTINRQSNRSEKNPGLPGPAERLILIPVRIRIGIGGVVRIGRRTPGDFRSLDLVLGLVLGLGLDGSCGRMRCDELRARLQRWGLQQHHAGR